MDARQTFEHPRTRPAQTLTLEELPFVKRRAVWQREAGEEVVCVKLGGSR
jgi:hypothetical protein